MTNQYKITSLDLPGFVSNVRRSVLGGDDFITSVSNMFETAGNYPPYNVEKITSETGEVSYKLTFAVAGFTKDEVKIETKDGYVIIRGEKLEEQNEDDNRHFIHRGIATRNFTREFKLMEYVMVTGASMEHGMLTVHLKQELPEGRKSRLIDIH